MRRYKRLFAAAAPFTRGRFAAHQGKRLLGRCGRCICHRQRSLAGPLHKGALGRGGAIGLIKPSHPPREAADAARRAYIPLLRPRPRSLCRGGLYGRPEPAAIIDSLPESRPGKRAADSRPYGGNGNIYIKKLLCAAFAPRSRAVRAALEKRSVAVTASRFHWPARSREGEGSTGRDGSVERNGLRNAASWDARRAAPMGVRGPQPRRILGTFLR